MLTHGRDWVSVVLALGCDVTDWSAAVMVALPRVVEAVMVAV